MSDPQTHSQVGHPGALLTGKGSPGPELAAMKAPSTLAAGACNATVPAIEMPVRADEVTTSVSTYARARAGETDGDCDLLADVLTALARAARQARSAVARLTWREAMARRSRRVGLVLDAVPLLVPSAPTHRVKRPGAWDVLVASATGNAVTVMTIRSYNPARTFAQLAEPIPVEVHRPELVDAARLQLLEQRGVLRLVASPASAG